MRTARVFALAAPALVAGWVLATYVSVSAQRRPSATESAAVTVKLPPQPAEQGYVGEDRCRACHRAEVTEFEKTPHARLVTGAHQAAAATSRMDCESCHGPGKAHADGEEAARGDDAKTAAANLLIFSFRGTTQQNSARCLSCHTSSAGQQAQKHSMHAATGVACQSCHATHLVEAVRPTTAPAPRVALTQFFQVPQLAAEQRWLRESLLKESQPDLCYSCHASARTQFALPFHHRVNEGAMKCTDCHNAHGTDNRPSLVSPNWETCTKCHADKHGPFLFEHAPVKAEGCAICHTPHGATSRFMLARRESRFLCLQCHGDTHSDQVGVPHSRLGFQTRGDCTRCHVALHGSNFNPFFLQ